MSKTKTTTSFNRSKHSLHVDTLEPRNMLSTVSILATGQLGGENMKVFVNDEVVIDVEVTTDTTEFSFESSESFGPGDLRIEFTNDLYMPNEGIDRNLIINQVVIDGVDVPVDASSTFSTGTWLPNDGVSDGFGRGDTLHANGYFEFGFESQIDFGGETWQVSRPFASDDISLDGSELVLRGTDGPVSLFRKVPIQFGGQYEFVVDAYREILAGEFTDDNQPWATAGINFYTKSGTLITQETLDVTGAGSLDPNGTPLSLPLEVNPGIGSAYMWIWIDGFEDGTDVPLRVQDIRFDLQDPRTDFDPPIAFMDPELVSENTATGLLEFLVFFEDNEQLGDVPESLSVVGPNGFEATAVPVREFPEEGNEQTFQRYYYGFSKDDGSIWTADDNGIYSIGLGENALIDAAGNVASAQIVGEVQVFIEEFFA